MPEIIQDLEQSQIQTFYEAVGQVIQSQNDPEIRQALVLKLMELPNQSWSIILNLAKQNTEALWEPQNVKQVVLVLKTNSRVASSLGHGYIIQLGKIYLEMLHVYKTYSQYVSQQIQENGPGVIKNANMKSMRAVKKETLKLIQTFIKNCQDSDRETIFNNFLPALMDPVLDDYKRNVPDARDAEVLSLFGAVVTKLAAGMTDHIPRIFESCFQCTLDMITPNFTDFPDHRVAFFGLIREINTHCFPALLRLSGESFQLVMNSIIWAIKHLERNIQDTGLNVLYDLLRNVETSEVANSFFKTFFASLVQDLLGVLTDTFHKAGFRMQATILAKLFNIIESGAITVPLWNQDQGNFQNNQSFVRDYVSTLLAASNLTPQQAQRFVMGLFEHNSNIGEFKSHLRDFLVQLKGFDSADAAFLEEKRKAEEQQKQQQIASVPGLLYTGPSSGIPLTELHD